ncbi:MAG: hypothetical protein MIO90_07895, partial [Methanomassiliicoccales archaeon]|nr:hypothetical protein [Methanomassiliicoccales archaeon]
ALVLTQGVHAIEYYSTDRAGNKEAARSVTIKVDTDDPIVEAEVNATPANDWYRSAVTVSLLGHDGMDADCSVLYRLDGDGWTVYQDVLVLDADGEHLLEYYATDDAGNSGTIGMMDVNIDITAPQCDHSLQGEMGEEGRYITAVNVTLMAIDATSGVGSVMYRVDDGDWRSYSATFSMNDDGIHVLEHYAIDLAGNQGTVAQVEVVIDSQGPTVVLSTDPRSSNGWFKGTVAVTLTSDDHFDQDCPVFYRLNGGEWRTYVSPFSIGEEGWHVLEYYAVDLAGNQGAIGTQGIGLDITLPDCEAALQGATGLNDHFVSQVSVTLLPTDDSSGAAASYYRLNGGTWAKYQGTFALTAEGSNTLEFYAVDMAGNIGPIRTCTVDIDTRAPVVIAVVDREASLGWFNSTVLVALNPGAGDAGSAINYRLNGGPWTLYTDGVRVTQDGANLLEWYGTDLAGNQAPTTSMDLLLDLTAPECSLTFDGEQGSNGYFVSAVELGLVTHDVGSGTERALYRLDGGDWVEFSSKMMMADEGDHTIEFYAQDLAGNSGDVLMTNFTIDTSSPEISIIVMDDLREDGTYLNHATVRFVAEDEVSGVAAVIFSLDGSAWLSVDDDVLVEGEGLHVINCSAMDLAGNNATATEIRIEISMPLEAPEAVQGLTAAIIEEGIRLQWSPSPTGLEARYLVYRTIDGDEELIANITGTSYLDTDVVEGVTYDYRVVPLNVVGEGPSTDVTGLALPAVTDDAPYLIIIVVSISLVGAVLFLMRRWK